MLNLCIPAAAIEPMEDKVAQGWQRTRRQPTASKMARLRANLGRVPLPVTTQLETTLAARELLDAAARRRAVARPLGGEAGRRARRPGRAIRRPPDRDCQRRRRRDRRAQRRARRCRRGRAAVTMNERDLGRALLDELAQVVGALTGGRLAASTGARADRAVSGRSTHRGRRRAARGTACVAVDARRRRGAVATTAVGADDDAIASRTRCATPSRRRCAAVLARERGDRACS